MFEQTIFYWHYCKTQPLGLHTSPAPLSEDDWVIPVVTGGLHHVCISFKPLLTP